MKKKNLKLNKIKWIKKINKTPIIRITFKIKNNNKKRKRKNFKKRIQ